VYTKLPIAVASLWRERFLMREIRHKFGIRDGSIGTRTMALLLRMVLSVFTMPA